MEYYPSLTTKLIKKYRNYRKYRTSGHSKQKVGQSWSKLVALGHWAKLVKNGQVTNYELYVQLVTWGIWLGYLLFTWLIATIFFSLVGQVTNYKLFHFIWGLINKEHAAQYTFVGLSWVKVQIVSSYLGLWSVKIRTMSTGWGYNILIICHLAKEYHFGFFANENRSNKKILKLVKCKIF